MKKKRKFDSYLPLIHSRWVSISDIKRYNALYYFILCVHLKLLQVKSFFLSLKNTRSKGEKFFLFLK